MTAVLDGEKLALAEAGGKVNGRTVILKEEDDASRSAGAYDTTQCASNAYAAVSDPTAVAYIGDFNTGCTHISLPITNAAGLAQISPGNTGVGLTVKDDTTAAGEPGVYYPTGSKQTYARNVPNDQVQGAALALAMQQAGAKRIAIYNDGTPYGDGLAKEVMKAAAKYGLNIVTNTAINPNAPNYYDVADSVKNNFVDTLLFAGDTAHGGIKLTHDVNARDPKVQIFAPDAMCLDSWVNQDKGGLPHSADPQLHCTAVGTDLSKTAAGSKFVRDFDAKYGAGAAEKNPFAVFGYDAMQLTLNAIKNAGVKGNDRAAVVQNLMATKNFASVLGAYSIKPSGDTTRSSIGEFQVVNGQLRPQQTLTPSL
jgi:branched-chain amino acid transport system substrate-binding protein